MPQEFKPQKPKVENVTLNYTTPSDKHLAFHAAHKTATRIICGGVGCGKTVSAAYDIISRLMFAPAYQGKTALVAGISGTHCRELLLPEFQKILRNQDKRGREIGMIAGRHYKVSLVPLKIEMFGRTPKGVAFTSKILFVSLEAGVNLRGYNASIVYADDLGPLQEDTWNALCDRAFREEDGVGSIIGTLNPGAPSHWVYKRYIEKYVETGLLPEGVYLDTWTIYDNPFLKARWKVLEQQYAHSPVEFKRKVMGEWIGQDGLVYSNFNRDLHVVKRPDGQFGSKDETHESLVAIQNSKTYVGLDFGQRDPTAAVWVAKYWSDANQREEYLVYREYYVTTPNRTIKDHADYIKRQPEHIITIWSDHYSETVNTYKQYGVNLHLADKGHGSVQNGISLINQLLADKRLHVLNDCKNVLRELESYEWKSSGRDEPKDKDNHTMDALRYVLWEIAGKNNSFTTYFGTELQRGIPSHTLLAMENAKRVPVPIPSHIIVGYRQDGTPVFEG